METHRAGPSPGAAPGAQTTAGFPSVASLAWIMGTMAGSGGFVTTTTSAVAGSRARAARASVVMRPPTAAERSRPPTPIP